MSSQKLFSNSSKELFSEKFYDAMNNDSSDLSKYDNESNDIHVHNPKDKMIKICKKYLRYLEYCKLLHNENSLYKVSILFNYWLYGMLTHIYGANNTDKIITGFSALQLKWTYFDYSRINNQYYKKCKPELSMVNHHDWDKRKKLFDYYVDYDTLSTMAKSFDDDCERSSMQHASASEQDTEVGPHGPGEPGLASGSETEVTSETSQIGTKVGQSVLGITSVLLTASALYRL
ncbi:Plasmodium vivax Vir protein, putative, partial [Plasmodium ovale]